MKKYLIVVLFLVGCDGIRDLKKGINEIEKCEIIFQEKCSFIAVPNSAEKEAKIMYLEVKKRKFSREACYGGYLFKRYKEADTSTDTGEVHLTMVSDINKKCK